MDQRRFAHEMARQYRDEIVQVARDLVRIPSANTPPTGVEGRCQAYMAAYLRRAGLPAELYELDSVPGLTQHPAFWPGRDYHGRPNLSSRRPGRGGGRSLLLNGHCDTVPLGESAWTYDPYAGEIHAGRLYGLGSIDMKGPLGALLVLYKALAEQDVTLKGTLAFESVVDEELAGVNATIAGRLRDGPMDGAVIAEGTDLRLYPAARGLLSAHLFFKSDAATWLELGKARAGDARADVIEQVGLVLSHLADLQARRRRHPVHPLYQTYPEPAPAQVTKVYVGGWGTQVPNTVPAEGRIELMLQTLPGEERASALQDQEDWLAGVVAANRAAFGTRPETVHFLRWMPGTAMDPAHPLVTTLAGCVAAVSGQAPAVMGAPFACDLYALQQLFGMPALVFGPHGANAHGADEYLDLDSLCTFWEGLLLFVLDWCGVA
jgi:acetylornithine deacetylase